MWNGTQKRKTQHMQMGQCIFHIDRHPNVNFSRIGLPNGDVGGSWQPTERGGMAILHLFSALSSLNFELQDEGSCVKQVLPTRGVPFDNDRAIQGMWSKPTVSYPNRASRGAPNKWKWSLSFSTMIGLVGNIPLLRFTVIVLLALRAIR